MHKNDGSTYVQSTRGEKFEWCISLRRDSYGRVYVNATEGANEGHFFMVALGNGPNASRNVRIETPEIKRITAKATTAAVERMKAHLKEQGFIEGTGVHRMERQPIARPARAITLAEAKSKYVHRFTMEHVPSWARKPCVDEKTGEVVFYYAPQYRSDAEWYENTIFPGEVGHYGTKNECHINNQTWPLGQKLTEPYRKD